MSKVCTLSKILLYAAALAFTGCRPAQNTQIQTDSFSIQTADVDPQGNELKLSWTPSAGVDMYRVWISQSEDCHDVLTQVAVQKTEYVFRKFGPGTYYACVHAVPKYTTVAQDSCSSDYVDVDGVGYPAENQGRSFQVPNGTQGSWKKFADERAQASVLSRKGGLILQSTAGVSVHDDDGKVLLEAKLLTGTKSGVKAFYAFAQGRLIVFAEEVDRAYLALWDTSTKGWIIQAEYPAQKAFALEWVSPTQLIMIVRSDPNKSILWYELDPLALTTPKLAATIPIPPEQGSLDGYVATRYRDGAVIVVDYRGIHSLTTAGVKTLILQSDMEANRLHLFPGTQQEYLIQGGSPYGLMPSPSALICSILYVPPVRWYVWNGANTPVKPLPQSSGIYAAAGSRGLYRMEYRLGGNYLIRWTEGTEELLLAPPFTDGYLLGGDAVNGERVLVNHGAEVWVFTQ